MTIPSNVLNAIWTQLESPTCSPVLDEMVWKWYSDSNWICYTVNEIQAELDPSGFNWRDSNVNELLLILAAEGETIHYD